MLTRIVFNFRKFDHQPTADSNLHQVFRTADNYNECRFNRL